MAAKPETGAGKPDKKKEKKKEKKKPGLWAWFQRHEKIILTGLVIGILPAFGMGTVIIGALTGDMKAEVAAEIDGREITMKEFREVYKRFFQPLKRYVERMSRDERFGAYFRQYKDMGNEVIWKRLALLQEARERNILVTDLEVQTFVTDNPNFEKRFPYFMFSMGLTGDAMLRSSQLSQTIMAFYDRKEGEPEVFNPKRYKAMLKAQGLTEEEFEKTIREDLMIRKLRYFAEAPNVVPVREVYEDYKEEEKALRLSYVRFDAAGFEAPPGDPDPKDLKRFYLGNRKLFEEPRKKSFEYIFADRFALEERIALSENEKRTFYEENKETLFRKKDDGGGDADDEEGDGADDAGDGAEDGGGEAGDGPGDAEEDGAGEEGESPAFQPFDDPGVQKVIERKLRRSRAEKVLEKVLGDLAKRLRSIERRIKRDYPGRDDQVEHLRSDIVFSSILEKMHADPGKWGLGEYPAFRLAARRHEELYSREEIRTGFGAIGVRVADKIFQTDILAVSDPLVAPEGVILVRGLAERQVSTPPLEEIRDRVVEAWRDKQRMDEAFRRAGEVREKMASRGFAEVAAEENLTVHQTTYFNADAVSLPGDAEAPPLGKVPNLVRTAFSLQGELSVPVREDEKKSVFVFVIADTRVPPPRQMNIDEVGRMRDDRERENLQKINEYFSWEAVNERHDIKDHIRNRSTHKGQRF